MFEGRAADTVHFSERVVERKESASATQTDT
jgi:hypothetical protein